MRLLIFIAMVIIFISAFFMFFIFDATIKNQISCFSHTENNCNTQEAGKLILIGLSFIGMFIIIDVVVIYLVIKNLTVSTGYV